jgi:putative solute:sodium symporter small subunit
MSTDLKAKYAEYWQKNVGLIRNFMIVWFLCSYGAGILFAPALNGIQLCGFKLGFWFAQNGAIYCFFVLIWVYVWTMNGLDEEYGVNE